MTERFTAFPPRWLAAFAIGAACAFAPLASVAQDVAPDALVRKSIDEVLAVIKTDKDLQAGNQRKILDLVEEKVLPHFDFGRMTRLALGRNWAQASDAQKEALVREFRTLLVRTYSTSLSQYRNQTIDVKPAKIAAGDTDTVVKTLVNQPGGQPIPIDYSMEKSDKGWRVYDVVVDGVSLVTTYRGSFNDQIQKGGIDGLVKTLSDRNRGGGASPKAPAKAEPSK
jgi:phospholipid transport system substrate-binding protein